MKWTLRIPQEPISINKVHCRDVRYYTTHFKQWTTNALINLSKNGNKKKIEEIKDQFNPNKHYIHLEITSFYPREQMFTASGSISSKTHDLSNIEKPLIDVLFLPKFHGVGSIMKGPNLNMDDKYIKSMLSVQKAADDHLIEITIEFKPLEDVESINC